MFRSGQLSHFQGSEAWLPLNWFERGHLLHEMKLVGLPFKSMLVRRKSLGHSHAFVAELKVALPWQGRHFVLSSFGA